MEDRVKPFASVYNFRDFGHYAGADGKRIRSGVLFRSGHYGVVSDQDAAALDALGVTAIVDLRAPDERRAHPSKWPSKWDHAPAQLLAHEQEMPNAFMGFVTGGNVNLSNARDYMLENYTRIPFEPGHIFVFRAGFERLLNNDGAFLVHCMAGKDRTGIFCALAHHVLGVSDENRQADYLLTNEALQLDQRIALFADFIAKHQSEAVTPDTVRAIAGVHEDYLEQSFAAMREQYGSVDAYLQDELKVGAVEIRELRAKFLA